MVAKSLKGVPGGRCLERKTLHYLSPYEGAYLVGVVGEWVWIGLCLVEVLHTREVPPTLVSPHLFHHVNYITVNFQTDLDEPSAQHDPDYEPTVSPDHKGRGGEVGGEPGKAEKGHTPDGQET